MIARSSFLLVAGMLTAAITASAEKVNMNRSALRKTATHVIVGTVQKISARTETTDQWETTYYVADVRVESVEKGENLAKDEVVPVNYWHRRWIAGGPPPPSTNGHRGMPSEGQKLRIYLARGAYHGFGHPTDDLYHVIGANGFEALKPTAAQKP